jgi:UPF0716 family protein affecting phage T7 exclusion
VKSVLNAKTLQMLGGGIIVAGAFAIMFPDMITYFGGIAKLLLMVVLAIASAAIVTRTFYKLKTRKAVTEPAPSSPVATPTGTTDTTYDG